MSGYALPTSYWEERGESVIKPIGPLAQALSRLSNLEMAHLMIGLSKIERWRTRCGFLMTEASFKPRKKHD